MVEEAHFENRAGSHEVLRMVFSADVSHEQIRHSSAAEVGALHCSCLAAVDVPGDRGVHGTGTDAHIAMAAPVR